MRQLALGLPPLERDPAIVDVEVGCQAAARLALAAWREWPGGTLALTGPEGAGKSHLAQLWAREAGARFVDAASASGTGPLALEDPDRRGADERRLLALLDGARSGALGPLLMTLRTAPGEWRVALPDLASRLALAPAAAIGDPSDEDLAAVFVKHIGDRGAEAAPALVDYVIRRIERSFAAAERAAEALDRAALERKQRITRKLAADVLGGTDGVGGADER